MSLDEIELLFSHQRRPAPKRDPDVADSAPGNALTYAPLSAELARLAKELSEEAGVGETVWDQWDAYGEDPLPGEVDGDPDAAEMTNAEEEALQRLRELEVTAATLDDTTVDIREKVEGLSSALTAVQVRMVRLEGGIDMLYAAVLDIRNSLAAIEKHLAPRPDKNSPHPPGSGASPAWSD